MSLLWSVPSPFASKVLPFPVMLRWVCIQYCPANTVGFSRRSLCLRLTPAAALFLCLAFLSIFCISASVIPAHFQAVKSWPTAFRFWKGSPVCLFRFTGESSCDLQLVPCCQFPPIFIRVLPSSAVIPPLLTWSSKNVLRPLGYSSFRIVVVHNRLLFRLFPQLVSRLADEGLQFYHWGLIFLSQFSSTK